jgi:hypothetical protein
MTAKPGAAASLGEALAILRELRDATERAVVALERDDPDAAAAALAEGERASARLDALFGAADADALRRDPRLRAEADAIRVLQAVGLDKGEAAKGAVARELEALTRRDRDLRGYRPADGADRLVDLHG